MPDEMPSTTPRSGLSLVETIVSLAIVSILAALSLSGAQRARHAALRAACTSNLRQVATGVHSYAAQHGTLPPGCAYPFAAGLTSVIGQVGLSWQTSILPHVEQRNVWEMAWKANSDDPRGHLDSHDVVARCEIPIFICPAEANRTVTNGAGLVWALNSYLGVAGTGWRHNDGVFHPHLSVRFGDITDGTSSTAMVGERPPGPDGNYTGWYSRWGQSTCRGAQILGAPPADVPGFVGGSGCRRGPPLGPGQVENPCSVAHYWSLHPGGANFAFADGSVRFLSYSHADVLPALATRAGGEAVSPPD